MVYRPLLTRLLFFFTFLLLTQSAFAQHYQLWGTTYEGGANGGGTLFRYSPQTDSIEVLMHFGKGIGPVHPYSGVLWDSASGKIYGTFNDGGRGGASSGGIYSFRPYDRAFTIEYDCYPASNGRAPLGVPVRAGNHTLWGTDMRGGSASYGTLYEFDMSTGVKTVRKNFATYNSDGYDAYQSPVFAANGKLYGLTHGAAGVATGVLYCYDTALKTFSVKHAFTNTGGNQPKGRMLACSNGKLYGVASSDFFEFDPTNDSFIVRQSFQTVTTGSGSQGFLLEYAGGIWGLGSGGGANGRGTIFRYDTVTRVMTKKADLDSTGASPLGGLCLASNGLMYAATATGGTDNIGAIISFDPITNKVTNHGSFNYANGWNPLYTTLTAAWTNECPQLLSYSISDTLCAGAKDSLNLFATDGDGDTLRVELNISDTSKIHASEFQMDFLGGEMYSLKYAADTPLHDTGWVTISGHLVDGYGGITKDSFIIRLYLKDCTPPPVVTAVANSNQGRGLTLSIHPNPTETFLWMSIPGSGGAMQSCVVIDALGRQQSVMFDSFAPGQGKLSIAHLPSGVYHLRVSTTDGGHYTASFVRQ
jgi:uncharacterized repeat protein (TIGR03803 family)